MSTRLRKRVIDFDSVRAIFRHPKHPQKFSTSVLILPSEKFQKSKAIFAPPTAWYSSKECIWYDGDQIEDKTAISTLYPGLREFFVDFLGVTVPDLGMLVKELKTVSKSSGSVDKVKSLIWQINSMDPSAEDLRSIYNSAIFPVKVGNGSTQLQRRREDFVIVDREKLANGFKSPGVSGAMAILDFMKIEDVHKLRPFLAALDVEDRYLSNMVKEITFLTGDAYTSSGHDEVLTASIRRRAYALFRYQPFHTACLEFH